MTVVALTVSGYEHRQCANKKLDYTPRSVERSGPAIREVLLAYAPERCAEFEEEFLSALAVAKKSFDLSGPQAVLKHWQAVAIMEANPLTNKERENLERARAGDFSGLITRHQDDSGNWVRQ